MQYSGYYGFVVVFANAETVLSITQVSIDPAKVCGVEWIDCHGFLDKIEFVATNDVRFCAGALVSCRPIFGAVLFDFLEELVCPQVFQLNLDIFSVFVQIVYLALHFDCWDRGFRAVNDEIDWDLEEGTNKGETFLRGSTFGAVFVQIVAGRD